MNMILDDNTLYINWTSFTSSYTVMRGSDGMYIIADRILADLLAVDWHCWGYWSDDATVALSLDEVCAKHNVTIT